MKHLSRRNFLRGATLGFGAALFSPFQRPLNGEAPFFRESLSEGPGGPLVISSANGKKAAARTMEMLKEGRDTLDAVVAGVNLVEDDPDDITVGLGGLPNEEGIVQLDASVMHGPTYNAGAVASLERIKNPSSVARLVMERTDHVLIVGEGALRFAKAHGFKEEELLTERSRKIWLRWKEKLSANDDWFPPQEEDGEAGGSLKQYMECHGTIHCSALDAEGNLSGVTTTSGLSFKIPGRVGDSPIIGAGLYVDNEVGACGATDRGEAVILSAGSASVVENMRKGMTPLEAALDVLRRIVRKTVDRHLLKRDGRPEFNVKFYAISKKGEYAGASIWSGSTFVICDDKGPREEKCHYLFEREE